MVVPSSSQIRLSFRLKGTSEETDLVALGPSNHYSTSFSLPVVRDRRMKDSPAIGTGRDSIREQAGRSLANPGVVLHLVQHISPGILFDVEQKMAQCA